MTNEAGAVGVMAAALAALTVVMGLLAADVARLVVARTQLTTAADAAALAAAPVTFSPFGTDGDPTRAAADIATANRANLVMCRCPIDRSWATRRVVVEVGMTVDLAVLGDRVLTAAAAAEFQPIALVRR